MSEDYASRRASFQFGVYGIYMEIKVYSHSRYLPRKIEQAYPNTHTAV